MIDFCFFVKSRETSYRDLSSGDREHSPVKVCYWALKVVAAPEHHAAQPLVGHTMYVMLTHDIVFCKHHVNWIWSDDCQPRRTMKPNSSEGDWRNNQPWVTDRLLQRGTWDPPPDPAWSAMGNCKSSMRLHWAPVCDTMALLTAKHRPDFKIMCISGGMSERRGVTVEILCPQIFAGLNTFNPQGEIKYESKNKVQVVKNGEQWFFSSRYHENRIIDPFSALVKPVEFLPQTSRDFRWRLEKMAYFIFNGLWWLGFVAI